MRSCAAKEQTEGRSEFFYGTFSRTVSLPAGADQAKVKATYSDGILEITMPVSEHPRDKHVKIQVTKN